MSDKVLNNDRLVKFEPASPHAIKNWYTMLAGAVAVFLGVDEGSVVGLVAGAPLIFDAIIELVKKTRKPTYTGNFIVYLFGGLGLALPSLGGIIEAFKPIAEVLISGGAWTAILPFVLGFINQLFVFIRTKNKEQV